MRSNKTLNMQPTDEATLKAVISRAVISGAVVGRAIKLAALTLAVMLFSAAVAAQAGSADAKLADAKLNPEIYQTFFLANVTQQNDLNDIQTDLRNMIPMAKICGIPTQNAITIRAAQQDMQTAQKLIAELDRPKKLYRLTYTITEAEDGKRMAAQRYAMVMAAGIKSTLKQGNRVPIVTGSETINGAPSSQVQYIDLGLNVEATVDAYAEGV